jgi:hypothetical protein
MVDGSGGEADVDSSPDTLQRLDEVSMRTRLGLSSAITVVLLALAFAITPVSARQAPRSGKSSSVVTVAKGKKHRQKSGKKKQRKHKNKAVKKGRGKKLLGRNRRSRQAIHHALNDKHPTTQPSSKK